MPTFHLIEDHFYSFEDFYQIFQSGQPIQLSAALRQKIDSCHQYLHEVMSDPKKVVYGINTGFGDLCDTVISPNQLDQLQVNLIKSHAAGTGDLVPTEVVRAMLLLKIRSLSFGHSGVSLELVDYLIRFYNEEVYPEVFQLGSLGASGDLAPLAHLSLPLLGCGRAFYQNKWMSGQEILNHLSLEPYEPKAKEGLALLNGTQFSLAYAMINLAQAYQLYRQANHCVALSLDGFNGNLSPFDERLHLIRPHKGQLLTAAHIRSYLVDSAIQELPDKAVQDPYSLRCVPQVHGAAWDTFQHAQSVIEVELNSVTDNPNIFPETDAILSGGNFHAQHLAFILDFLAIALSELGSISERRIFLLLSGKRGLPAFLAENPGLNSGLMIAQYTAASITSQNQQLCTPASASNVVSSNGQEDHVSMAANAATKGFRVGQNVARILAIEWFTAAEAVRQRTPTQTSPYLQQLLDSYRRVVRPLTEDRIISIDMATTEKWASENL